MLSAFNGSTQVPEATASIKSLYNELIRKDIGKLEEKFELFTCALAAMVVLIDQIEAIQYEHHL